MSNSDLWPRILAASVSAGTLCCGAAMANGISELEALGWFLAGFGGTSVFLMFFTYVE